MTSLYVVLLIFRQKTEKNPLRRHCASFANRRLAEREHPGQRDKSPCSGSQEELSSRPTEMRRPSPSLTESIPWKTTACIYAPTSGCLALSDPMVEGGACVAVRPCLNGLLQDPRSQPSRRQLSSLKPCMSLKRPSSTNFSTICRRRWCAHATLVSGSAPFFASLRRLTSRSARSQVARRKSRRLRRFHD
jgi:hypothetical protein